MIVRVLTAHVPAASVGAFDDAMRSKLDALRVEPGLVYAKLARRVDAEGGAEVALFEEWRSPEDLWAWTKGRPDKIRLLPGAERLANRLRVDHYESLDAPDDDRRRSRPA